MRYLHIIILTICVVALLFTVWFAHKQVDSKSYKVYNCDLAEFHPDFPLAVKQKCRELRNENSSMQ
jgi:hypothetical protein